MCQFLGGKADLSGKLKNWIKQIGLPRKHVLKARGAWLDPSTSSGYGYVAGFGLWTTTMWLAMASTALFSPKDWR